MTRAPRSRQRIADQLGFRIAFLLAIVLLPLAIISSIQSVALLRETKARVETALLGETLRAAAAGVRLIEETAGTASALALSLRPLVGDTPACTELLSALVKLKPFVAFAAYVPTEGVARCTSARQTVDFRSRADFRKINGSTERQTVFNRSPQFSKDPILALTAPVFDTGRTQIGYVWLSVPVARFFPDTAEAAAVNLFAVAADGEILPTAASAAAVRAILPAGSPLAALARPEPLAFRALDASGTSRIYAIVPIVPATVYAVGSRPANRAMVSGVVWITSLPAFLPAAMWLASLIVAWFAANRLVIRHIGQLSVAMRSFAGGARVFRTIDVADAPLEIRDMVAAFERMAENVIRNEAELEGTIHEREVLLREVHHRVRNNLQLIASIMNMQLRRVSEPTLRNLLKGLQDRVLSIASIHGELFHTSGLADIDAGELLSGITRHFSGREDEKGRYHKIHTDLDPIRMTPERAVPLALLVTEAINGAISSAAVADPNTGPIAISLKRDAASHAILTIESAAGPALPGPDDERHLERLGAQLVEGFTRQLDGVVEGGRTGGRFVLTVRFPLRALAEV